MTQKNQQLSVDWKSNCCDYNSKFKKCSISDGYNTAINKQNAENLRQNLHKRKANLTFPMSPFTLTHSQCKSIEFVAVVDKATVEQKLCIASRPIEDQHLLRKDVRELTEKSTPRPTYINIRALKK